jgi:hypothetical protein
VAQDGTQPGRRRDGGARPAGPRKAGGRRGGRRPPGPGRWGGLQGGLGVCIIVASAAVGTVATVVTRSAPGSLLGLFVVAGTVVAALAVRPRAGRMILPVPALSYLVSALTSGIVYRRGTVSSGTALAIGATQWVADGFFAMLLATVLAAAIIIARWYLWRRRRPAPRDPGWAAPSADGARAGTGPTASRRGGAARPPGATWETSGERGYPAGPRAPGGSREADGPGPPRGPTDPRGSRGPRDPRDPRGQRGWDDTGPGGRGRRADPRPGTGPYNFSSGA